MSLQPAEREQIARRIEELISQLQESLSQREQAGETVELDQTRQGRLSRMDAMQAQEMAKAGAERAKRQLQALRAAARRLAEDDFGYCIDCDDAIALPRLMLDPAVRRCIACAEAAETPR